MTKVILILAFLLFPLYVFGAPLKVGDMLPDISGETLAGGILKLPNDASGKIALLVSSFTKKGGQDAQRWAMRCSLEFAENSNVICYSAIFLESVPRLFRGFVISGIKKGIPKDKHSNAIRVTKDEKLWKERMGVSNNDVAYLILLDRSGKIIWMHGERFNDRDFAHLKEQIDHAMK